MGISGLLPLLKEIQVHGNIKDFKGKRLAVDAYVWLHKGAFGCAEDLVKGKRTTKFVDYAMYRVRLLRHHSITPFIVFDGGPLPAKKGTEVSRAKSRAENLARANSLESQGRHREAREYYTKCVDITPEMAYQLIKALRAEGVDYVVAPYEADAQLYYLEREGYVDGIITEDSDLLVFGCKQVIFKLDGDGNCVSIHRDRLATISQFPMHGWTNTQFRRMAMLSGCDYLPSISGMGLKTAHRLLRRLKTVEKVLSSLRLEGAHRIPDDYIQAFNQAELAFMYQRIFCLKERKLMPLNDFPEGGLDEADERWIGLDVSIDIAQGMATGEIHPETRVPIVDEWPEYKPVSMGVNGAGNGNAVAGPSRPAGRVLAESSKGNRPSGPMDAFVSRKPILPKPVGAASSGPTRLSELCTRSPPAQDENEPDARRRDLPRASKFFGSTSTSARPARNHLAKWPSGEGIPKEQEQLVWEKSDEAGPEVDNVASPQKRRGPTPAFGAWSSPLRSPSPLVSSLRADSSQPFKQAVLARRESAQGSGTRSRQPDRARTPAEDMADAPHFSSPPPTSPVQDRDDVKREYALSSPPDVGRERSCSADPFTPSPSPPARASAHRTDAATAGLHRYSSFTQDVPTQMSDLAPESLTPTKRTRSARYPSDVRPGVLIPMTSSPSHSLRPHANSDPEITISSAKRLKRAKRELGIMGSSDSIEGEDELVTPSFDASRWHSQTHVQAPRSTLPPRQIPQGRQLSMKRSAVLASSCELDIEEDLIVVEDDEDEDVTDPAEALRREEEARRKSAEVVAVGWRDKFAMKGKVNGRSSSPAPSEPRLKRRKTDPTPWSPLTPPAISTPKPRSQQMHAPAPAPAPTFGARASTAVGPGSAAAKATPDPASIQLAKRAKATPRPLSAFAPRVLSVRSPNLPENNDSPTVGRSMAGVMSRLGAENATERAGVRGGFNKGMSGGAGSGGGGLARFRFSGEVERVREVL